MVTTEDLAAEHYLQQSAVSNATAYRAQAMWQMVDRNRIADSWAEMLPQMVQTVTAAQYAAASGAQGYITGALQAQGLDDAGATIVPSAFAGTAADGRPLASLLSSPAYTALDGIKAGASVGRSMASGLAQLVMLTSSTVTDAGRVADGVTIATRATRTGYIRMLSPPSCARCAILAGKFYRWNDGFQRHPQCKCIHIPTEEGAAGDKRTDPSAYFKSLSPEDQRKYFTDAGAKAINDGADINQVVNSRRGMNAAGMKTTEGTSKRGYYRVMSGSGTRLTPEAIYKLNGDNRAAVLIDLEKYGYIMPMRQAALQQAEAAKAVELSVAPKIVAEVKAAVAEAPAMSAYERDMQAMHAQAAVATQADRLTYESTLHWSDDKLMGAITTYAEDPEAVDKILAIIDQREVAAAEKSAARAAEVAAYKPMEAERNPLLNPAVRPARQLTANQRVDEEYAQYVSNQLNQALEHTNGVLFNRANLAAAKARGVDEYSLFTGSYKTASKYASDELQAFWRENGRETLGSFRYKALGRASDRKFADAVRSNGLMRGAAASDRSQF